MISTMPITVGHGSRATSPQTKKGTPRSAARLSTWGSHRCRCGTAQSVRADQNRSPRTPFVIQAPSSFAGLNARGLSQIHRMASATGTRHHQPSQARLQTASTKSGRQVVKRVQPLHGLAWRAQPSSSSPNAREMRDSAVRGGLLRRAFHGQYLDLRAKLCSEMREQSDPPPRALRGSPAIPPLWMAAVAYRAPVLSRHISLPSAWLQGSRCGPYRASTRPAAPPTQETEVARSEYTTPPRTRGYLLPKTAGRVAWAGMWQPAVRSNQKAVIFPTDSPVYWPRERSSSARRTRRGEHAPSSVLRRQHR